MTNLSCLVLVVSEFLGDLDAKQEIYLRSNDNWQSCNAFQDGESGWSSLHRALHFGHLAVASVLLQSGASITLEDSKSRTPIDLLSGPVKQVVGNGYDAGIYFNCVS